MPTTTGLGNFISAGHWHWQLAELAQAFRGRAEFLLVAMTVGGAELHSDSEQEQRT